MIKAKLILLTSIGAAFCAGQAMAQSAPAFDWTGPYVGLNAGGVTSGKTRVDRTSGALPNNTNALQSGLRPSDVTLKDKGFTGGGQVGYNFQAGDMMGGGLVMGVEADIAYTDLDKSKTLSNTTLVGPLGAPSAVPVTRINQYNSDLKYLGTVRGRVGVAFDQMLIYGTGGLAYGKVERNITFFGPNAPTTPFFTGDSNGTKSGWSAGGGVELALASDSMFNVFQSSGITVKAEYLHYDLGHDTLVYPGVNGGSEIGSYTSRVKTKGDIVRAGINYKF